jgi:Holliday junction resolvasome RuvABC DNA-binding subunit
MRVSRPFRRRQEDVERIVLELVACRARGLPSRHPARMTRRNGDDVVSALVNLGYHRPLAEKAAEAAIKTLGSGSDASFERALKQALREVAK